LRKYIVFAALFLCLFPMTPNMGMAANTSQENRDASDSPEALLNSLLSDLESIEELILERIKQAESAARQEELKLKRERDPEKRS